MRIALSCNVGALISVQPKKIDSPRRGPMFPRPRTRALTMSATLLRRALEEINFCG